MKDRAKDQAAVQYESIAELVKNYEQESQKTDRESDDALQAIYESPLDARRLPMYEILLCTGGPAVRIIGELGMEAEGEAVAQTARLQYQDWGTTWIDYPLTADQENILVDYAYHFSLSFGKEVKE